MSVQTQKPISWTARLAALPILLWRYGVSPVMPPACRFYPSCSEYGLEALRRHGAVRGLWLTGRRIVRCQPWSAGGIDPVPQAPGESEKADVQGAYLGRVLRHGPASLSDESNPSTVSSSRP